MLSQAASAAAAANAAATGEATANAAANAAAAANVTAAAASAAAAAADSVLSERKATSHHCMQQHSYLLHACTPEPHALHAGLSFVLFASEGRRATDGRRKRKKEKKTEANRK